MATTLIKLSAIKADPQFQPREKLNEEEVKNYAELIKEGHEFPPIVVVDNGNDTYSIVSGFHRFEAHKLVESKTIEAEVRKGSPVDILIESIQSNAQHGLKYTNDDKQRCIKLILDYEESKVWADNRIAKICGVSNHLVKKIRGQLDSGLPKGNIVLASRGGTVYEINKARIGKSQPSLPSEEVSLKTINNLLTSKMVDLVKILSSFRAAYDSPKVEIPFDFDEAIFEFVEWYKSRKGEAS